MVKTPQVKPDWNTGIYIGDGVVAAPRKMKTAICFDETGQEVTIEISDISDLPEEWSFRYWQEYSDRELAEWRIQVAESETEWFEGDY